ncbi:SAV_6107 family HEPN domain-containing protein [Pseudonocardia sp. NPDC049635]|uniref:SAV_6107 family HEPN domain-containing protein n=1 Tax=Pseudonocardia sp. NPDC049635 TaxID=3155506 RepID=UPI0033D58795
MSTTMELDLWPHAAGCGPEPVPADRTMCSPAAPSVPPARGVCRGGERGPRAHRPRARGGGAADGSVPPPSRDALALLRQAAEQLAEAHGEPDPMRRYPAAYLAALRAGAAVLAMRARPRPRRGAPRDVWRLLAEVAPELQEWASYFASCSRVRAAAEAGIERLVDRRGADDLLRQAEQFVGRVQQLLPR